MIRPNNQIKGDFGLFIKLIVDTNKNIVSLMKPSVDRIICGFHSYPGSDPKVCEILGDQLEIEVRELSELFTDTDH